MPARTIQSKYVWKWSKESHRGAKLKKERKKEKQNHISRDMKSYVPYFLLTLKARARILLIEMESLVTSKKT